MAMAYAVQLFFIIFCIMSFSEFSSSSALKFDAEILSRDSANSFGSITLDNLDAQTWNTRIQRPLYGYTQSYMNMEFRKISMQKSADLQGFQGSWKALVLAYYLYYTSVMSILKNLKIKVLKFVPEIRKQSQIFATLSQLGYSNNDMAVLVTFAQGISCINSCLREFMYHFGYLLMCLTIRKGVSSSFIDKIWAKQGILKAQKCYKYLAESCTVQFSYRARSGIRSFDDLSNGSSNSTGPSTSFPISTGSFSSAHPRPNFEPRYSKYIMDLHMERIHKIKRTDRQPRYLLAVSITNALRIAEHFQLRPNQTIPDHVLMLRSWEDSVAVLHGLWWFTDRDKPLSFIHADYKPEFESVHTADLVDKMIVNLNKYDKAGALRRQWMHGKFMRMRNNFYPDQSSDDPQVQYFIIQSILFGELPINGIKGVLDALLKEAHRKESDHDGHTIRSYEWSGYWAWVKYRDLEKALDDHFGVKMGYTCKYGAGSYPKKVYLTEIQFIYDGNLIPFGHPYNFRGKVMGKMIRNEDRVYLCGSKEVMQELKKAHELEKMKREEKEGKGKEEAGKGKEKEKEKREGKGLYRPPQLR